MNDIAPNLVAALRNLSPDDREAVILLAVEIATAPEPIEGLTPQETKLVRVLQAARGRPVPRDALSQAIGARIGISGGAAEPVCCNLASVVMSRIRRKAPRIAARIVSAHGSGLAWREPTDLRPRQEHETCDQSEALPPH